MRSFMSRLRFVVIAAAALVGSLSAAEAADAVKTRAASHPHFGRVAFDWPAPVTFEAKVEGLTVTIHFARPLSTDLLPITRALPMYVAKASLDQDGTTLTLGLKRPVTLNTLVERNTVAIDLVEAAAAAPAPAQKEAATQPPEPAPKESAKETPETASKEAATQPPETAPKEAATETPASAPPAPSTTAEPASAAREREGSSSRTAAPTAVAALPADPPVPQRSEKAPIDIRVGEHDGFSRVVLEWSKPLKYSFSEQGESARVHFAVPVDIDAVRLAKAVAGLGAQVTDEGGGTTVTLFPPAAMHLRQSRNDGGVVLDFVRDKSETAQGGKAAKLSPNAAKPNPTPGVVPPPELIQPSSGASVTMPLPPAQHANPVEKASAPADSSAATTLPVHYSASGDTASVRFAWPNAVPAAIFRRSGALWILFGADAKADLAEVQLRGKAAIEQIEQIANPAATVLRIRTRSGLEPSIRRVDDAWVLDLKAQELHADVPIGIEADPAEHRIVFEMRAPAQPIAFADPDVGDRLLIVPTTEIGRGLGTEADVVDFRALVSLQGLVLRPNTEGVVARIVPTGIEVTGLKGLLLSDDGDRRLGTAGNVHRLFDFSWWRGPEQESFLDRRSELEQKVAEVAPSARSQPRLALAEFYFANGYAAETLGVLDAIERDDPTFATDRVVRALKGAAALLHGDVETAAQELRRPNLDGEPEVALWRGALAVDNGDWPVAAKQFTEGVSLLTLYPKQVRNRLALEAAEALIRTDQASAAGALIELVEKDSPSLGDHAMAQYLKGLQSQAEGDLPQALETWQSVAVLGDRPSRARALKDRTLALLDAGKISRSDAIQQLDALRFSWRGGAFEFDLLRSLGTLLLADGDVRRGLDVLSQAVGNFPHQPDVATIKQQMADAFSSVFVGKIADQVSPLKALALYDEFKDLVPQGADGEKIVRSLADRLIAVDLLYDADALLDDRVTHRLAGLEKARGATELAFIRLLDHRPDAALSALQIAVDGNLPANLARQREQLQAHALADLGHIKEALAALDGDNSRDADRMRADIYWKTQAWADAAQMFERLVPVPATDAKLDDSDAHLVLNWAAALTLAGDREGVSRLNDNFAAAMTGGPYANAFRLIAGDDSAATASDPRERAKQLAEIGELKEFAAQLRNDLASGKTGAIN
jgi:tetratricopeptide (TPR) repeat protein